MNRLFAATAPPTSTTLKPAAKEYRRVDAARVRKPAPAGDAVSFFAPEGYESNYSYPLVIWLHNAGGDERQLARVMPLVSTRNYVGLGVRGPVAAERRGYAWPQTAEGIVAAEQQVADAIARAQGRFNIHTQRIFLAGYQSGGTMAFRIALRNPERFAAAASIGGPFPEGQTPLAKLAQLRKFPLLLAHCRDSQSYPIDRVCQELKLLHAAAMCVTLRQYPCDDEVTTQMLTDLDRWLMEQVTGVAASEEADSPETESEWN
jgi:phospholipase/carboxylesterase